jgi:hypothetical protein
MNPWRRPGTGWPRIPDGWWFFPPRSLAKDAIMAKYISRHGFSCLLAPRGMIIKIA